MKFFDMVSGKMPDRASKISGNFMDDGADIDIVSAQFDKWFPQKGPVSSQLELF